MQISWQGFSCFEITVKTSFGDVAIVTDPYGNETGLRFPRTLEADILVVSHDTVDANNTSAVTGTPFLIKTPGEYEVKGAFVYAFGDKANLLTRFEAEDIVVAHLGKLNRALTDAEIEFLAGTDILMLPVGGGDVLTPKLATEVMAQVEPKVVIPMTHAVEGAKVKLETADAFCKAVGVCKRENATKYKVARKDLPEEDTIIMVLER